MSTLIETNIKEILPLHYDVMSRHIFGYQGRVRFLESLLEAMFKYEKGYLKGTKILNSVVIDKNNINDKDLEMDIVALLPNNEIINLEFYQYYDLNAETKSFMYITRSFSSVLNVGDSYDLAKKISQINFVKKDYVHENKNSELIRKYIVINEDNHNDKILPELFKVYIVDVDVTKKIDYNLDDEFVRWSKLIGAEAKEEMKEIIRGNEIMEEVYEEMKRFSEEKWVASGLFPRERLIRSQAKTQGKQEGANNRNIEIAKNMLKKNYDIKSISEITNLTLEQIKKYKEELND